MSMKPLIAAAAGLALGACSILPEPPPPPDIYPLRAQAAPAAVGEPAPLTLGVGRPNAVAALSTLDVVWVRDGLIAYLPQAAWPARMPEAMQALMAETVARQNLFRSAIRVGEGPQADYELRWDVNAFNVEETPQSLTAEFAASVRLMQAGTREVIAARTVAVSAPIRNRSAQVAVTTLQGVAAEATAEIGRWAAAEARRAEAAREAQTARLDAR